MKQTLNGPRGAKLHIDPSQVFHDDPGAGTPALVEYKRHFGSYWCVCDTADCDGITVPQDVINWLDGPECEAAVESLYH